jgi:uncharacterized protein with HEPN domain
MPPETRKLLADAQQAARAILAHAGQLTPQQYEGDVVARSLVERQCEVIGEALRRLERRDPATFARIPNARRIVDFRNVISHGYDIVDPVVVCQIVRQHIPALLRELDLLVPKI